MDTKRLFSQVYKTLDAISGDTTLRLRVYLIAFLLFGICNTLKSAISTKKSEKGIYSY